MKTPPDTPDFSRFTTAVRDILKVSKAVSPRGQRSE
jgi:hypothetical protein